MRHLSLLMSFFLASFTILSSSPCLAQEAVHRVLVTVIVASDEGSDFNLDNDAYRDQLIRLFSYQSYNQVDEKLALLGRAEREKIALPEEYELVLTYQGEESGKMMVQALIRKGQVNYLDTVLAISRPGVVFVGGPPVGSGVLLLVLEAGM